MLDEPSNGLDPAGMREVRQLLRRLGDAGVTVLLSSHLLGEVQQICDTVTIINHGRVVTAGRSTEVLAVAVDGRARGRDRATPTARARGARRRRLLGAPDDGGILVDRVDDGAAVARALAEASHYPSWLMPQQVDLEQAFLALTDRSDEGEPLMSLPTLERRPTHHALSHSCGRRSPG